MEKETEDLKVSLINERMSRPQTQGAGEIQESDTGHNFFSSMANIVSLGLVNKNDDVISIYER